MSNQIIINYYSEGNSLNSTSNKFKITIDSVKKILRENGVKVRDRHQQTILENMKRNKGVNHLFFENLDAIGAYYLGFLAADGCVYPKSNQIKIGLSAVDKEWLEQFRNELEINRKIGEYTTNKGYNVCECRFASAKIKQTLAHYDIVPGKTYLEISMKNVPDDLKIHYIRGFFDGDGSFSWNKNTKQGAVKIASKKENILKEIKELFPKGNLLYYRKKDYYSLEFSTLPSIEFLNQIYDNATHFLPRKKQKFDEFILFRNINLAHETRTPQRVDEKIC